MNLFLFANLFLEMDIRTVFYGNIQYDSIKTCPRWEDMCMLFNIHVSYCGKGMNPHK